MSSAVVDCAESLVAIEQIHERPAFRTMEGAVFLLPNVHLNKALDPLVTASPFLSLLAPVLALAETAGNMARDHARRGVRSWRKADGSIVTEADVAIDHFLRAALPPLDPAFGWLSEESTDDPARLACETVWIVDPIDGTRNFYEGGQEWAIAIALVCRGCAVLGVVHNPATGEVFSAVSGEGARHNGMRIENQPARPMTDARVVAPKIMQANVMDLGATLAPGIHSLAYRLAKVTNGTIDAALSRAGAKDWDLAAADIIVRESGAVISALSGVPLVYNTARPVHPPVLAARAPLHERLMDGLSRHADNPERRP